jgi:hypothetical protein
MPENFKTNVAAENFEKNFAADSVPESATDRADHPPDYQSRAIYFAQGILSTARAFPTRLTPEIPDKEYAAVVQRVKEAAEFLIHEGIMRPRFAPTTHDRPESAV